MARGSARSKTILSRTPIIYSYIAAQAKSHDILYSAETTSSNIIAIGWKSRSQANGVYLLLTPKVSCPPFSKFANGSRRVATGTPRRFDIGGRNEQNRYYHFFLFLNFARRRRVSPSRGEEITVWTAGRVDSERRHERERRDIMASTSRVCLRGGGGGGVVYPRRWGRVETAVPIISASNCATATRSVAKNPSRTWWIIGHA